MTAKSKVQSIEPNIADMANSWLKSYELDYKLEQESLNTEIDQALKETEYEELIRLRAENAYIKAEIEVIKKESALREEMQAAQLKAKKQRSLKNSGKKDIN